MITPLERQVMLLIGPITSDEFWAAVPKAHAKLFRIIEREGDANGARLTIDYIVQLIAEHITIDRLSQKTLGGATVG